MKSLILRVSLCMALLLPLAVHAADLPLAAVNMEYVLQNSTVARDLQRKAEALQTAHIKEVEAVAESLQAREKALEQKRDTLKPEAFEQKVMEFQRDVDAFQRKDQEFSARLSDSFNQGLSKIHGTVVEIVTGARERKTARLPASDFQSITGKGITGVVNGKRVAVGNASLFESLSIKAGAFDAEAERLRAEGQTAMMVAIDGAAAGVLGVTDPIKASAAEAIQLLHEGGLRITMLTGDSRSTAESVARRLGIDDVEAEVSPERKLQVIRELKAGGHRVAMAGDGVNDAPSLAEADVGLAMGTGTDVAMESAGVILVGGDLRGAVRARRLSQATMRNIRQNLFFAFVYNAIGVPIAAGALYPLFGLVLSPMIASAAMTFSSVSVIANALRLRHARL